MKYKSKHEKAGTMDTKKRLLIVFFVLLLLITLGVTVWALFFRTTAPVLAPDYAPRQTEDNAEPLDEADDGEKLHQPQGGGAVSLTFSKEVTVDLSEKTAKLMFANPHKSNQDMLIQIVVQNTVLVQSGILTPGYQITQLDLFDAAKLSAGRYDGKFVVLYYHRDTGEKSMLNTEIPITITVEE